jgi:hypothetical protein
VVLPDPMFPAIATCIFCILEWLNYDNSEEEKKGKA